MPVPPVRMWSAIRCLIVALLAAVFGVVPAMAQAGVDAPLPRPVEEIRRDLADAQAELNEALPDMEAALHADRRATAAPKALPPMRRMVRLLDEMGRAEPQAKGQVGQAVMEVRALMAVLGDVESNDYLARMTVSRDEAEQASAKIWSLLVKWVHLRGDAVEQAKLMPNFTGLSRVYADNVTLVQAASLMHESAATPTLAQEVENLVARVMVGEAAQALALELASRRKLASLENQPLVIEGVTVEGARFSTAQWKGKVVIVDFWATWCPPCVAEMPELAKFYAAHKEKGLEVVGVSSDRDARDVRAFMAKVPGVTWPQLVDPMTAGLHPLAEKLGVARLPTVIIIDRQGIVRTVKGRETYKELVPKLLEEK